MLIYDYFKVWIDTQSKKGLKTTTIALYDGYLRNYINKGIGNIEIEELTFHDIQSFYDSIIYEGNITIKTLRNIHSAMHRALKDAIKKDLIKINPADYVEIPKQEEKEVEILKEDELKKLEDAIEYERLGISIKIAIESGLRLGEIMALKWHNIDFIKKELEVEYSLSRHKSKINNKTELMLDRPKTKNSIRRVPINEKLIEALLKHKEWQKSRYFIVDIEKDFVLSIKYMKPIDPRTIQDFFKRMQIKSGIDKHKFHALRHTFASKAIKAGVSDKVISKLLGHSNVSTTLNIYAHISDEMMRDSINKM